MAQIEFYVNTTLEQTTFKAGSVMEEKKLGGVVADLKARLEGRPYIFKLAHRIQDDRERIGRLRDFERQCGVDLIDYVQTDL